MRKDNNEDDEKKKECLFSAACYLALMVSLILNFVFVVLKISGFW